MRKIHIVLGIIIPLLVSAGPVNAKGCLKGAAVGGVAGHVAGHHAIIGAAVGCAVEAHREKVQDKKKAAANSPAMAASDAPVAGTSSK